MSSLVLIVLVNIINNTSITNEAIHAREFKDDFKNDLGDIFCEKVDRKINHST
jgi:hypothetical protein